MSAKSQFDLEQVESFIREASNIVAKVEQIRKENGVYFNIFTITEREDFEESTHCRFLYELLYPKGRHYQNDLFLRLFFSDVLKEEYPSSYVHVDREKKLTKGGRNYGRLDLYIAASEKLYIIEVKIHAGEQPDQITRYCKWAEKSGKKYQAYFLTLDGYEPSSAGNYKSKIITLSFKDNIIDWLDHCKCKVSKTVALREAIEQYKQLLIKLTGKGDEDMKELKKLVSSNIQVADEIAKQLPEIKGKMMERVFDDVKKYIDATYGLECIDICYKDKCKKYYTSENGGARPGVAYRLDNEQNAYCAALRIEVYENLYFGGQIYFKNGEKWEQIKGKSECPELFSKLKDKHKFLSGKDDSDFFWWRYLEVDGKNLNFKNHEQNYFQLYDKDGYEKAIKEILEQIDDVMAELKIKKADKK